MNAIDGTNREIKTEEKIPPSLLTIVIDTNPHAWAHLSSVLPLSAALANLLVFINAHLSSGNANEVAVIASHTHRAAWLYPTPQASSPSTSHKRDVNGDTVMNGTSPTPTTSSTPNVAENPNKYRPFAVVESAVLSNFQSLLNETTESQLSATPTTLIGGALSLALSHIAKRTLAHSPLSGTPENPLLSFSNSELSASTTGATTAAASATTASSSLAGLPTSLQSRILILSVSGDLANQYVPIMNAIFAAQRKRIPIDILKLYGDAVLLQQASDATGGIYMKPERPEGILQYLMMGFLGDSVVRKTVVVPSSGGVDFRAACFCHRKVVDVGFVCSVCLSIFCEANLPGNLCLTCGSYLSLRAAQTAQPALIPKKKKKKKRLAGTDSAAPSGASTPIPG